jgi:lipopolysaccharide/colanic/teichoic acid biosynthesis glycosyltransferase
MITKRQKAYLMLKRAIDIFGSFLGILLLSPLMILAAIITKCTSKGPVLFKQKRLGKNEKPFTLLKFRSMRVDAKQIPPEKMTVAEQQSMVTNWGKFMRKTSIDEFPQLFNIFIGDMSFIGPRPSQTREYENELVEARQSFIPSAYEVKPGLGGFSQVFLRRNHDIYAKAKWDSYYVQHMSLWFDFKTFVWSFLCLFGYEKGR